MAGRRWVDEDDDDSMPCRVFRSRFLFLFQITFSLSFLPRFPFASFFSPIAAISCRSGLILLGSLFFKKISVLLFGMERNGRSTLRNDRSSLFPFQCPDPTRLWSDTERGMYVPNNYGRKSHNTTRNLFPNFGTLKPTPN